MQFWGESKMPLDINGQGSISGITSLNTSASVNLSETELGYLDGVTSGLQTQINEKLNVPVGWTSWSPVWTATGATPTYGNGVLYAKYIQVGKTLTFNFSLTWGSTTTTTGTQWLFSLPPGTMARDFISLSAVVHNGNNGATWRGSAFTFSNNMYCYVGDNTSTRVGSGTPSTWGTSWFLCINGTYEIL